MKSGTVSCRNLGWIFDLCTDRHIDPKRILKHVSWSREQLQDPAAWIDWESFLTLLSNLGNYFSDEQLLEAGAASWDYPDLRPWVVSGRLLRSCKDQFAAMYSEAGVTPRLYPVSCTLREVKRGHLEVTLAMRHGLMPCRAFQVLLAGQMIGLPAALGEPQATVHVNQTVHGATFDIWYQPAPGPISLARKLLQRRAIANETAGRLSQAQDELVALSTRLQRDAEQVNLAEQRARESEIRYRVLEHHVKDVMITMDANQRIHYVSASVQGLCGYTPTEVQDMNPGLLFTTPSLDSIRALVEGRVANGDAGDETTLEIELFHKDGSTVWAEFRISSLADAGGHPAVLIGVISDISERKSFEANLSEHEASYRAITTTAQDGIITVDEHHIITFANPAAFRIFDYRDARLEGRPLTDLMPDAPGHVLAADNGAIEFPADPIPVGGLRRDGSSIALEASFAEHETRGRRYTTWIIRDVTFRFRIERERKTLEQQLHAIQRMESIGQLTGGIAHDFNNLLVAINGYADLAMARDVPAAQREQYLSEIRRAGGRAADMTHKLLAFSRRQIIEPSMVDVNQLIKGLERMIVRLLPENIQVRFLPALQNPTILADAGQIEQVLVNLAVNARDAMSIGGKLTISVDQKDASALEFIEDRPTGREFAVIRVEDTGHGMAEDVRKRIFEPFFTTKPEGEGTGLGMSVAFGIVKQHEGYIDVSSRQGRGTRFEIYLPVADSRLAPTSREKQRRTRAAAAGSETILLVEDNSQVRDLARLILAGAGYKIVEAPDGVEALEIFERDPAAISLVIMDVVMPRMGGKDVMVRLRNIRPDVRILFTSGYSSGGIHTNFILEEGLDFIQKPYDAETLRARVRYVLDNHEKRAARADR